MKYLARVCAVAMEMGLVKNKRDCKDVNYYVLIKSATNNNNNYDFSTLLQNDKRIMKTRKRSLYFRTLSTSLKNIPLHLIALWCVILVWLHVGWDVRHILGRTIWKRSTPETAASRENQADTQCGCPVCMLLRNIRCGGSNTPARCHGGPQRTSKKLVENRAWAEG